MDNYLQFNTPQESSSFIPNPLAPAFNPSIPNSTPPDMTTDRALHRTGSPEIELDSPTQAYDDNPLVAGGTPYTAFTSYNTVRTTTQFMLRISMLLVELSNSIRRLLNQMQQIDIFLGSDEILTQFSDEDIISVLRVRDGIHDKSENYNEMGKKLEQLFTLLAEGGKSAEFYESMMLMEENFDPLAPTFATDEEWAAFLGT